MDNLDASISNLKRAVDLTPDGHPGRPECLFNLSLSLLKRYECLGDTDDLDASISNLKRALELTPDGHPGRLACLNNLGDSLQMRFDRLGAANDLDASISNLKRAVELTPRGHPERPGYLHNLGNSLRMRFEHFGDTADLSASISNSKRAVDLTPYGHPKRPGRLNNLGVSLLMRFERLGNIANLDAAISNLKQAVDLTPHGHSGRPMYLSSLGGSLLMRFGRLGDMDDLEASISNIKQAVDLTPDGHPDRPARLTNLSLSLLMRFRRLGNAADLHASISNIKQAVDLTPDGHPDRAERHNNLSLSLLTRFEHFGDIADLDASISNIKQAVDLTPDGHPHRTVRLNNLGISLLTRFERLGDTADLDASTSNLKRAVELTPRGHPERHGQLNNLGWSLRMRFERVGDTADLDASILNLQQAVDLTPDGHPDRPVHLNNLGHSLQRRFECLDDTADLDASISNLQQAVGLVPYGHPHRAACLNRLGSTLQTRFECLGDMDDLDACISNNQRAVDLTPEGHPDRPMRLNDLGCSLQHRFRVTKAVDDLEQSLRVFNEAASSRAGRPAVAFEAALHWANLAREQGRSQSALDGYSAAVRLLPRVAWLGLDAESRQAALLKWSGNLARDAASYAIGQSQLEQAVEFLDEGRSVIWAQAFALRTGLDELRVDHPELADRLERVGRQLDRGAFVDWHLVRDVTRSEGQGQQQSPEQVAQHHRRLASEWDELVERVRGLAGFEHFLRPLPFAHLRRAAEGGPVVIVNVSERQVDALIIRAERDVERVPLPGVDAKTISAYAKNLARDLGDEAARKYYLAPALRSIWESIVVPILNALGVPTDGPVDKTQPKPHIWWCPTGPLTFIPLHAAGSCANGQPDLTERVISSYTTTLSALLRARDSHVRVTGGRDRLLIVGQDPGEDDPSNALPKLAKEVVLVESLAKKAMADEDVETLRQGKATVDNVLKAMGECAWVHLSCHGHQHAEKPMESAFILHEGRRLRLSDIASQRLQQSDFAFLSACHTAVGATGLSDESIHLAAALQCAGFRSVIATTRAIYDQDGPTVAEHVYRHMFRGEGRNATDAARALNEAVLALRRDKSVKADRWIPFVHIGI